MKISDTINFVVLNYEQDFVRNLGQYFFNFFLLNLICVDDTVLNFLKHFFSCFCIYCIVYQLL